MSFNVAAAAYDRFMGLYSSRLTTGFADFAGIRAGQRVLNVGCGPGALVTELVARLGPEAVAAADPSEPFVAAVRSRHPAVEVRLASAGALPWPDRTFDAALAQLVVHFLKDPAHDLAEMARVTDGIVAASVWDFAGGRAPVSTFWRAARALDPAAMDESGLPGGRPGHLAELLRSAGLSEVAETEVAATIAYAGFDAWWEPYTLGVGPAGAYHAGLPADRRAALREACRQLLPNGPFSVTAVAWAARGVTRSR